MAFSKEEINDLHKKGYTDEWIRKNIPGALPPENTNPDSKKEGSLLQQILEELKKISGSSKQQEKQQAESGKKQKEANELTRIQNMQIMRIWNELALPDVSRGVNVSGGLSSFANIFSTFGLDTLSTITQVLRQTYNMFKVIDDNLKSNNLIYLKTHTNLDSSTQVEAFNNMLQKTASGTYLNKDQRSQIINQLSNLGNLNKNKDDEIYRANFIGQRASELYGKSYNDVLNSMIFQQGMRSNNATANMSVFKDAFMNNTLGIEKSLTLAKQLFDTNRRFNGSMQESAGYIQKFSQELQRGTSTIQDITSLKTTIKSKDTGGLAGIGQAMINAGFGTKEMNAASGNLFALAAIMRKADPKLLENLQAWVTSVAQQQDAYYQGRGAQKELYRLLYQSMVGVDLNEDMLENVVNGKGLSARELGWKPKSQKTILEEEKKKAEEYNKSLIEVFGKIIPEDEKLSQIIADGIGKYYNAGGSALDTALDDIKNRGLFTSLKDAFIEGGGLNNIRSSINDINNIRDPKLLIYNAINNIIDKFMNQ